MLIIKSVINENFSNGIYCEKYDVIIHKWTGYINASELCILKGINYLEWIKSPIYLSTCEYIRENLDLKPSHFMPHGIGATQGIYIHPLLLPYLILETGNTDFLRPMKKQNLAEVGEKFTNFLTMFKKTVKEFEPLLKDLFEEIKPIFKDYSTNDDCSSSVSSISLGQIRNFKPYVYSTEKKYDKDDSEEGDSELLRQKIRRQIGKLNKKKI